MSTKRRTKYHVRRRLFLNRDADLPAFIIAVVEDTRGIPDDDPKQGWNWGDIKLMLGDCYRRVSFDFDMDTPRDRADSLHKIRRLAEVVCQVRDAIETEVASISERPRARPEPEEE